MEPTTNRDGLSARRRIIAPLQHVAKRFHHEITPEIYGGLIQAASIIGAACHEQSDRGSRTVMSGTPVAAPDTTRGNSVWPNFTPRPGMPGHVR